MVERTEMLTVVVSVYNEEAALPLCHERLTEVLRESGRDYTLLFVNDGSRDRSAEILDRFAAEDTRVRVLHFSRNFGHEAAMIAGIDYAEGAVICMDADLQHPPQCIPAILAKLDEGFDVISMVRTANRSAGIIKNLTSSAFYGVMNALSGTRFEKNASDFFAVSARAAEVLRRDYRERVRFLRGYVQSLGFRSTALQYEAAERAAGQSKYSLAKLFRFSMNTIMSFSDLPLRLGIYAGIASGLLGLILLIYSIVMKVRIGAPAGYTTIIVVICFMFAVLFLILGIMGQYIGVLFEEIKGRPIYIVAAERGRKREAESEQTIKSQ
ncbi:glycosyltransferase family 2 protein [Stomatobaculum longum]|uniref:glycosyltransferase family 2 protein n=1 Tax=Stomatobaculum longum TaxID=796942 RepID=UPI0028D658A1|nr:glycosyltransferase family 2 protein [Stomatobaculum longum]